MSRVKVGPKVGCGLDLTVEVDFPVPNHASISSAREDTDSKGEAMDSKQPKNNMQTLLCLIEAQSTKPNITVQRFEVPDINEFGGKKIPNTSNPVFNFPKENAVVKCIEVKHNDPYGLKALIEEVKCVTSTECKHWVKVKGLFLRGNHLFMVMPKMVVMSDFAKAMHARGEEMPSEVLASMLYDWLLGLKALEARKFLHGDVKPPNLLFNMIDLCGKLSDFGSAGMHNTMDKYIEEHGLPPGARCTVGYCLPLKIGDNETIIDSKFDSLSAGLSALQIALGNKHPVFALSELHGLTMEVKESRFVETFLGNPNLLEKLENEGKLSKIYRGTLRSVLQQLIIPDLESRISPSKALELLSSSVQKPEKVRDFVNKVLNTA